MLFRFVRLTNRVSQDMLERAEKKKPIEFIENPEISNLSIEH